MKRFLQIILIIFFVIVSCSPATAQCSVCSKTAMQLGEKPAQGLNQGILYLMFTPFLIVGIIGYRWWKSNKQFEEQEQTGNKQ